MPTKETCFVTGGTGFVGSNLVDLLTNAGHHVKVLARKNSDRSALKGLDYELIEGGVCDRAVLDQALRGVDWCFHVAASYHLWMRDYTPMFSANVDGTTQVLESAGAAGCSRIVYTSTVGCIGLPKRDIHGKYVPTDETAPVTEAQMSNPYKLSKWRAEQVALALAKKGLPIVIVNPSAPIGPRDVKPTPTGQLIVDFLHGAIPAFLDTGLNWVHVRDVAAGHILAAQKGRIGERYILGHANSNWTMKQFLDVLAETTGLKAPKMQVPFGLALAAAHVNEWISYVTGKPPKAPLGGVRMARYKMWFNPAKAIRELGMPQTPPEQAVRDAVDYFRNRP